MTTESISDTRFTGRVKWFNMKKGFGFITLVSPQDKTIENDDIFVHFTALDTTPEGDEYRYLTEGEYVNFSLTKATKTTDKFKFQASKVTGIEGGPLMSSVHRQKKKGGTTVGGTVGSP